MSGKAQRQAAYRAELERQVRSGEITAKQAYDTRATGLSRGQFEPLEVQAKKARAGQWSNISDQEVNALANYRERRDVAAKAASRPGMRYEDTLSRENPGQRYAVDDGAANNFIDPRVPARGYRLQGEMGMSPGAGFDSLEAERDQLTRAGNEYGGAVMEKNLPRILAINQALNSANGIQSGPQSMPNEPVGSGMDHETRKAMQRNDELRKEQADLTRLYAQYESTPAAQGYMTRLNEISNILGAVGNPGSQMLNPQPYYASGKEKFLAEARRRYPDNPSAQQAYMREVSTRIGTPATRAGESPDWMGRYTPHQEDVDALWSKSSGDDVFGEMDRLAALQGDEVSSRPSWMNSVNDFVRGVTGGQDVSGAVHAGGTFGPNSGGVTPRGDMMGFGMGSAARPLPKNPNDYNDLYKDGSNFTNERYPDPMASGRTKLQNNTPVIRPGAPGTIGGTLNTNGADTGMPGPRVAPPGSGAAPLVPGSPLANGPYTGTNAGVSPTGSPSPLSNVSQNGGGLAAGTAVAAGTAGAVADGMGGWVVPAVLAAGGLVGAGANILTGNAEADAARYAADLQFKTAEEQRKLLKEMYDRGLALDSEMYNNARTDMEPWRVAGKSAITGLTTFDRDNAMPEVAAPFVFNNDDPSYAFRFNEGRKALENQAAARGGLMSGNTGKALVNYGQQAASQEYGNAFSRYQQQTGNRFNQQAANRGMKLNAMQSLAGVGQSAVQQMSNAGQNYANNASNAGQNYANNAGNSMMAGAQAQGQGATGAAAARSSGYGGAINALNSALGSAINYGNQTENRNAMMKLYGGY